MKYLNRKLAGFKQWILSIVRRSYSFDEMTQAYEEGVYEGTLREMDKEKGGGNFMESDLKYYMKGW